MAKPKSDETNIKDLKSKNLPATQAMLYLVRTELKSDISELRAENRSQFKHIDSRFNAIDARFSTIEGNFSSIDARFSTIDSKFNAMEARFSTIDARFDKMDSKFEMLIGEIHKMGSKIARIETLVEEQNSRNSIVLEGLSALFQRQERVEKHLGLS